jgi:hypothetical protein
LLPIVDPDGWSSSARLGGVEYVNARKVDFAVSEARKGVAIYGPGEVSSRNRRAARPEGGSAPVQVGGLSLDEVAELLGLVVFENAIFRHSAGWMQDAAVAVNPLNVLTFYSASDDRTRITFDGGHVIEVIGVPAMRLAAILDGSAS